MMASDQAWTLDAPSWCAKVLKAMDSLRQQNILCDTAIMASDRRVTMAHSVVLTACNNHMASIIKPIPNVVKLDYPTEALEQLLSFVYTGKMCIGSYSLLKEMSKLGEDLQLNEVINWCTSIDMRLAEEKPDFDNFADEAVVSHADDKSGGKVNITKVKMENANEHGYSIEGGEEEPDILNEDGSKTDCKSDTPEMGVEDNATAGMTVDSHRGSRPLLFKDDAYDDVSRHIRLPVQSEGHVQGRHTCATCGKTLSSGASLKTHIRTHTGEKPFKCDQCGNRFTQNCSLQAHIRGVHQDERPCKCSHCEKSFRRKYQLEQHENSVHATVHLSFKCRFCDVVLSHKNSWQAHEKRHTSPKMYKCDMCDKTFLYLESLKNHAMVHLGDTKEKTCDICGGTYHNLGTHRRSHERSGEVTPHDAQRKPESSSEHTGTAVRVNSNVDYENLEEASTESESNGEAEETEQPVKYPCETCGMALATQQALEVHLRGHTGEKAFSCEECGKWFTQKGSLQTHIRSVHRNERPYKCGQCEKSFKTRSRVRFHQNTVHARNTGEHHFCRFCHKSFPNENTLRIHEDKTHINVKSYKCDVCDKSFLYAETFKSHQLEHLGKPKLKACDGGLYHKLEKHRKSHDLQPEWSAERKTEVTSEPKPTDKSPPKVETESSAEGVQNFQPLNCSCEICGKALSSKQSVKMHMRVHTGEKPYHCEECGNRFTQKGSLRMHIRSVHRNERPHKCPLCEKYFKTRSNQKFHLRTVHVRNTGEHHSCRFCAKVFPNVTALKIHENQRHVNVKSYKCDVCGQVFKQLATLKIHALKHVGQSPHRVCDICGGVYRNLHIHKLTHNKDRERKHQCSFCPKQFHTKQAVVSHERFHTDERPYKCKHCDKAFHSGSIRNRHELTHTGERAFLCGVCGRTFASSWRLKTHKEIHSDHRPYKCNVCGKSFKQQTVLHAHTLIHGGPRPEAKNKICRQSE